MTIKWTSLAKAVMRLEKINLLGIFLGLQTIILIATVLLPYENLQA